MHRKHMRPNEYLDCGWIALICYDMVAKGRNALIRNHVWVGIALHTILHLIMLFILITPGREKPSSKATGMPAMPLYKELLQFVTSTTLHLGRLLDTLGAVLEATLLHIAALQSLGAAEALLGLPGGNTNVLDALLVVGEDVLDLLESLSSGLGEHEEDVEEHGGAEDGEDEVDLPLDIDERRRNEVGEGKVEDPVGGRGQSNTLATDTERKNLRGVDLVSRLAPCLTKNKV